MAGSLKMFDMSKPFGIGPRFPEEHSDIMTMNGARPSSSLGSHPPQTVRPCTSCRVLTMPRNQRKQGGKKKPDDTMSFEKDPQKWFRPEDHMPELRAYMQTWTAAPYLDCLDVFGASQSMKKVFTKRGFKCESFDVVLGGVTHDITTHLGFLVLLGLGLSLLPGALLALSPPCSLYIFLSSSVHGRSKLLPYGNVSNWKVQLSNRIVLSLVIFLTLLKEFRLFSAVLEQPKGSMMFYYPELLAFARRFHWRQILTYMGLFGHPLEKGSWIWSDLPGIHSIARKMDKKMRAKLRAKRARLNKTYYVVDKEKKTVQGTKELQSTAKWTFKFCSALFDLWQTSKMNRQVENIDIHSSDSEGNDA